MTSNNFERMYIVLNMADPFNYDDFLMLCDTEKIQPLSINEYAMKVGFVMMAKVKYPDAPTEEGYMKIVEEANNQPAQGCSSCGDKKDKPLPGIIQQAKNLTREVVNHVADGLKEVDEKTLEMRLKICNTPCEWIREDGYCSHPKCGCPMRRKAKWESAHCPENKW